MPVKVNKKQLAQILKKRQELVSLAKDYPLAISKLWRPHCHRFDGLGNNSKRPRGCGSEMTRVSPGVWACLKCGIKETRTSQVDPVFGLGREATLISGGNRAGKTELGAMLAIAFAAGRSEPWVREWIKLNDLPEDFIQE